MVRHARTGQCQVAIDQQDGQLSIEVTDSGRGGTTAGTGYGITGMRERRRPAASSRAGPMTIQVILADDQPLVRAGLRRLIEQTPDIDVAGEAGTGTEAVQLARDTSPTWS